MDKENNVVKQALITLILLLGVHFVITCEANSQKSRDLVPPQFADQSLEICLNSRLSYHSGLNMTVTDQQVSNVLWAAGRAPVVGNSRTIYLIDSTGKYIYHPDTHTLTYYNSTTTTNGFRITYDVDQDFDAGVSYTFALSAGVSTWTGTESQLASCPMGSDIVYGIRTVRGLTTELVAVSSDQTLPDPTTDGANQLGNVLAEIQLHDSFNTEVDLTLQQISQLLWGGYGCTPHTVNSGRAGLTVPSSWANYYVSERIYIVSDQVWRYCNRQGSNLTTQDHRLELVLASDVRSQVQASVAGLPEAPCYIILCPDFPSGHEWYSRLETGFLAGGVLLESEALGLGCDFKTELTTSEQNAIQGATAIPVDHAPFAVISLGNLPEDCIHDGDSNQDGSITAGDAQMAFFITLGMVTPTYEEACSADCNGSGDVTAADAQTIFLMTLGSGECVGASGKR